MIAIKKEKKILQKINLFQKFKNIGSKLFFLPFSHEILGKQWHIAEKQKEKQVLTYYLIKFHYI